MKENEIEDLEGEIWRDIDGYDGFYQISNKGRVRSIKSWGFGVGRKGKPHILKFLYRSKVLQYKHVCLFKDGKRKYISVHRLVAMTFLERKEGLDVVNHLDEDPSNNCVENLEWTDAVGNMDYSHIREKGLLAHLRAVRVFTLDMQFVADFSSLKQAAEYLGCTIGNVKQCCKGITKTCKGYIVRYKI